MTAATPEPPIGCHFTESPCTRGCKDRCELLEATKAAVQSDAGKISDLEMTRLCAQAMGIRLFNCGHGDEIMTGAVSSGRIWRPLTDDAQAMALVKRLKLRILEWNLEHAQVTWQPALGGTFTQGVGPLNRAIVECVAKMRTMQSSPALTSREAQKWINACPRGCASIAACKSPDDCWSESTE